MGNLKTVIREEYITLSELLSDFKQVVKDKYFNKRFWVVAEISEINPRQKGHCHLKLIEKEETDSDEDISIKARIDAVIWASDFIRISENFVNVTGQEFKAGIKILFNCYIDFHELYGLKLVINDVKPEFTLGEMHLKKEAIIKRLEKENLINRNKNVRMPTVIQKIAIVSSVSSAGLEDFINHLDKNVYNFRFYYYVFDTIVQGESAADSIINILSKIRLYKDFFDLVVIIRGGGSKVDLTCFDSYELSRAVAEFPLPVITGIGHTKDVSCVDLVSSVYFKTPTACAEFIVEKAYSFYTKVLSVFERASQCVNEFLAERNFRLRDLCKTLQYSAEKLLGFEEAKVSKYIYSTLNVAKKLSDNNYLLKEYTTRLKKGYQSYFGERETDLNEMIANLSFAIENFSTEWKRRLSETENKVKLLDPKNVLRRGYSITYYKGRPIKNVRGLRNGEQILTKLYNGTIVSKIKSFKGGKNGKGK